MAHLAHRYSCSTASHRNQFQYLRQQKKFGADCLLQKLEIFFGKGINGRVLFMAISGREKVRLQGGGYEDSVVMRGDCEVRV